MGVEIERKFLVRGEPPLEPGGGTDILQGYVAESATCAVRVRAKGGRAFLTVKGASAGPARAEFEYEVPAADAAAMLAALATSPPIEKTRHRVPHAGLVWEVDIFRGANAGLVVAEVELEREGQPVEIPDWVGEEVTHDRRYYNAELAKRPWRDWGGR